MPRENAQATTPFHRKLVPTPEARFIRSGADPSRSAGDAPAKGLAMSTTPKTTDARTLRASSHSPGFPHRRHDLQHAGGDGPESNIKQRGQRGDSGGH